MINVITPDLTERPKNDSQALLVRVNERFEESVSPGVVVAIESGLAARTDSGRRAHLRGKTASLVSILIDNAEAAREAGKVIVFAVTAERPEWIFRRIQDQFAVRGLNLRDYANHIAIVDATSLSPVALAAGISEVAKTQGELFALLLDDYGMFSKPADPSTPLPRLLASGRLAESIQRSTGESHFAFKAGDALLPFIPHIPVVFTVNSHRDGTFWGTGPDRVHVDYDIDLEGNIFKSRTGPVTSAHARS